MTEQKIPDGSVDIVKNVRKLETFLDKLLDGYGYKDADGVLEVFTDGEIESLDCQGYPLLWQHVDDDCNGTLLPPYDGVEFDATFSDWLAEQLFIDVCYERTDDLERNRFESLQPVYRVSGWCIDITIGGPTVRLKRDPFRGGYTYVHSWGVVSWADPSGHFAPRTSIEFSPIIGDKIHDYIEEMHA